MFHASLKYQLVKLIVSRIKNPTQQQLNVLRQKQIQNLIKFAVFPSQLG